MENGQHVQASIWTFDVNTVREMSRLVHILTLDLGKIYNWKSYVRKACIYLPYCRQKRPRLC